MPANNPPAGATDSAAAAAAGSAAADDRINQTAVKKAGDTMTGALLLPAAAADLSNKQAAPMDAVQAAIERKVSRASTVAAARALYGAGSVQDVAALALLTLVGGISTNDGMQGDFYWDSSSALADDGVMTIKPTGVTGNGRFRRRMPINRITPYMFGVVNGGGGDQSVTLQAAWDYMLARGGNAGDQWNFGGTMPAFYIAPGLLTATGKVLTVDKTAATIHGDGKISQINQVQFNLTGQRQTFRHMMLLDSRNIVAGTVGIGMYAGSHTQVEAVHIRDKDIGIQVNTIGNKCAVDRVQIERSRRALDIQKAAELNIRDTELIGSTEWNCVLQDVGEVKMSHVSMHGGVAGNLLIRGQDNATAGECYFNEVTLANAGNITFPILGFANNGAGKLRLTTGTTNTVTAMANAGKRMAFGTAQERATSVIQFDGTATGSVTSFTIGGVELLTGTVTGASLTAITDAVAAQINSGTGTHGYTAARIDTSRMRIYASLADGAAANWRAVVVTCTAPLTTIVPGAGFATATTGTAHGYTVGQDVRVNAGDVQGIVEVLAVIDATTFGFQFIHSATATGTTNTINRLSDTLRVALAGAGSSYDGAGQVILGCTDTTVDVDKAFVGAGTGTGTVTVIGFDLVLDARDQYGRTWDHLFSHCNINRTLIKSANNTRFYGCRLKNAPWIDDRAFAGLRTQNTLLEFARDPFTGNRDALPSGAPYGWVAQGMRVGEVGSDALNTRLVMMAPDPTGGTLNGRAAKINTVTVGTSGVSLSTGALTMSMDAGGIMFPAITFGELTPSLATAFPGRTRRVTDKGNRLATSEAAGGGVWRDQNGAVFA